MGPWACRQDGGDPKGLGYHLQCLTLPGCGGLWARHFDDLSRVCHGLTRRRSLCLGTFTRLMPSPLRVDPVATNAVGVMALCATTELVAVLVGIGGGYVRVGAHMQCLTLPSQEGDWCKPPAAVHLTDQSRTGQEQEGEHLP